MRAVSEPWCLIPDAAAGADDYASPSMAERGVRCSSRGLRPRRARAFPNVPPWLLFLAEIKTPSRWDGGEGASLHASAEGDRGVADALTVNAGQGERFSDRKHCRGMDGLGRRTDRGCLPRGIEAAHGQYVKIAQAIGQTLSDRYAGVLKEAIP